MIWELSRGRGSSTFLTAESQRRGGTVDFASFSNELTEVSTILRSLSSETLFTFEFFIAEVLFIYFAFLTYFASLRETTDTLDF